MRTALLAFAALLAAASAFAVDDADSLALRASQAQERGEYREAARLLREALASRPRDYWLRTQLAEDYARMGRLKEAEREWAAARTLDGKAKEAYYQEGYARLEAGDSRQAESSFLDAISADTSSPVGYRHMAYFLYKKGDLSRSERYFRQALGRASEGSAADRREAAIIRGGLGEVLSDEKRYAQADAVWRQGLERARDDPRAKTMFLQSLGRSHARQGESAQAERLLKEAAASCGKAAYCLGVFSDLAVVYAHQGRAPQAAEAARRSRSFYSLALQEPPFELDGYAGALVEMGDALSGAGKDAEAERDYRLAVALRPAITGSLTLADAERALAGLCVKTGRKAEARGLLQDALGIARKVGDAERAGRLLRELETLDR